MKSYKAANRWLLLKRVLEQSDVVLRKIQNVMGKNLPSSNINGLTTEDIVRARQCVSKIASNEDALKIIAQDREFQSLVNELQSVDMKITNRDVELARKFQTHKSIFRKFLELFE
jgi:hypothetical protein